MLNVCAVCIARIEKITRRTIVRRENSLNFCTTTMPPSRECLETVRDSSTISRRRLQLLSGPHFPILPLRLYTRTLYHIVRYIHLPFVPINICRKNAPGLLHFCSRTCLYICIHSSTSESSVKMRYCRCALQRQNSYIRFITGFLKAHSTHEFSNFKSAL